MSKPDYRSAEATAYRKLYKTKLWQLTRSQQLAKEPICRMCEKRGKITAATVCDHIDPHKGNVELFYSGPFQSLCKPCHDSSKQSQERIGYSNDIDPASGWPTDDNHPANR